MLLKYFFIFLFLKQVLGVPVSNEETSNFVFEDEVMKVLEVLRKIMKEGDPENGIPSSEPLRIPILYFDFYIQDTDLKGKLRSTVIRNISDFEVKNLTLNVLPKLELKLKVSFDKIYISGCYDLFGILFGEYPVKGVGTHNITLKGFAISADAGFRSQGGILNVRHLNATFDLEGISVSYKNLSEGEHEQRYEQKFLSQLLDRFRTEYLPPLLNTLKIIVNDFFVRISSKQENILSNILAHINK